MLSKNIISVCFPGLCRTLKIWGGSGIVVGVLLLNFIDYSSGIFILGLSLAPFIVIEVLDRVLGSMIIRTGKFCHDNKTITADDGSMEIAFSQSDYFEETVASDEKIRILLTVLHEKTKV